MTQNAWGKRWLMKVGVVATAIVLCGGGLAKAATTTTNQVDVRDFGAVGDGVTNDTAAIQKANDAVAAKGGGRVVFPAGVYIAGGVQQDSFVEFYGSRDAVLKHPNGVTPSSIVSSRRVSTTGTIMAGSRTLRVSSTYKIRPGSLIAILGAAERAKYLYSAVTSVGAGQVTLDLPATLGTSQSQVYIGAVKVSIRGLTLDGNKPSGGSTSQNAVPVRYLLARWATVADAAIDNGAHGAIIFGTGTSDSVIERNALMHNGIPELSYDSAIWLFQGASRNVVRQNVIGGASERAIFVDDQTTTATAWDAPSDNNLIENNDIDIAPAGWNAGIIVAGSNGNTIRNNVFKHIPLAVAVEDSSQGVRRTSQYNTVSGNSFYSHRTGIQVVASNNTFKANTFVETTKPYVITGTNSVS
jgi:parallel beta-helix repeat protein